MKIFKNITIALAFCMIAQNALVFAGKDEAKKEEKTLFSRAYEFVCEHKGKIAAALACIFVGNEIISRSTGTWSFSNKIWPSVDYQFKPIWKEVNDLAEESVPIESRMFQGLTDNNDIKKIRDLRQRLNKLRNVLATKQAKLATEKANLKDAGN
jgi:hypothetical protein